MYFIIIIIIIIIKKKNLTCMGRQPHRDLFQSLCGSGVTRKIKQLEVEGAWVPQYPIAGDGNGALPRHWFGLWSTNQTNGVARLHCLRQLWGTGAPMPCG